MAISPNRGQGLAALTNCAAYGSRFTEWPVDAALTPALCSDSVPFMKQTVTTTDLEWLESEGHWVDPNPVVLLMGGSITRLMGSHARRSR